MTSKEMFEKLNLSMTFSNGLPQIFLDAVEKNIKEGIEKINS